MGRHSRKQKADYKSYVAFLASKMAEVFEAKGLGKEPPPLPGQGILHVPGRARPNEPRFVRLTDGTAYAVAKDGSFRRAPANSKILEVPPR